MGVFSIKDDVTEVDEDLNSDSTDAEDEFEDEEDGNESNENSDEEDNSDDGSVEDDEDDEPALGEAESEDESVGNTGWADAMAKVLAMGKNSTKPVSVLSKAKKGNSRKRKASDGDSSSNDSEPEPKKLEPLAVRKARKKEIDSIGRKMPNVLERNSERLLSKIATKGVVQLFNAVRDHQKDVKTKLKDAGGSFRKQENVYKNLDKRSFIQMVSGRSVSSEATGDSKKSKLDSEDNQTNPTESSWNILRDDYMLGAKMKDWDRESDEET